MAIDRSEPIARYAERQSLFRRSVYSLFPGKVLARVERGFSIAEMYVDVRAFAEGHTDGSAGLTPAAKAVGAVSLLIAGAAVPFALSGNDGATPAVVLAALGAPGIVWAAFRVLVPARVRTVSAPEPGVGLVFQLRPERMSEIEAFIRTLMKERERMFREGPSVPLGPRERLNSAQRILRLKTMLDGGLISQEQFDRFKAVALKSP